MAVILPIAVRPGWPTAHDGALFQRVEAFRREFAAGNFFPLWTPFGSNGHGMPMPLFYHRLFDTVAGLLALVLGTVAAVKVTLVATLAVGAAGMAAAGAELGWRPWIRFWSGAILPIAHYTFSNWLVRGSAAELSAGMLLPWLIVACLRMQSGKPFGARLGGTLVLLFYAHAVIALYSALLVAVAALSCLLRPEGSRAHIAKQLARGLGIALGICAVGAGPYFAGILLIGPEFSLDRFSVYVPQHQFAPRIRYLVDDFAWGQRWDGLSLEIGRYLITALLVSGVIALLKRPRLPMRAFAFLAVSSLVYFWFQLPMAGRFFEAVTISQILQFPWRLLVFITPLVILMIAALAQAIAGLGRRWALVALGILAGTWAVQASFTIAPYRAAYRWMTPQSLAAELAQLEVDTAANEYLLRGLPGDRAPPRTELVRLDGCTLISSSADLPSLAMRPFETLELRLASPASGCTAHFSQFWTTLIRVTPSAGGRAVRAPDGTTDIILPAGAGAVTISRRGLIASIVEALRRRHPRTPG